MRKISSILKKIQLKVQTSQASLYYSILAVVLIATVVCFSFSSFRPQSTKSIKVGQVISSGNINVIPRSIEIDKTNASNVVFEFKTDDYDFKPKTISGKVQTNSGNSIAIKGSFINDRYFVIQIPKNNGNVDSVSLSIYTNDSGSDGKIMDLDYTLIPSLYKKSYQLALVDTPHYNELLYNERLTKINKAIKGTQNKIVEDTKQINNINQQISDLNAQKKTTKVTDDLVKIKTNLTTLASSLLTAEGKLQQDQETLVNQTTTLKQLKEQGVSIYENDK